MGRGRRPWKEKEPVEWDGMGGMAEQFFESMIVRGYSEQTLINFRRYLRDFLKWCGDRSISRLQEITRPILERYQRHLYYYRQEKNGEPISFRSQNARLISVRAFFRWLTKNNHVLYNPASELELPRVGRRLPRYVLTASEVEKILNQVNIKEPLAARDRAILETFYSTGMRRMELTNLRILDMDIERGTILIRQGKGKRDRMIPIGERASAWIRKYLEDVRPGLAVEPDNGTLFLTIDGGSFTNCRMTQLVRGYILEANIGKTGSCHLFRHTMATLMLENGADIRFIQQMLGHLQLATTEIYTQVSIKNLQRIFMATHPSARLKGNSEEEKLEEPGEKALPKDEEKGKLLSSLAAEAEEEEHD